MMRSMFSGVSGMKQHQVRMDVIGNNIANVNTAGFKGSRVTFQEALSQTLQNAAAPVDGQIGGRNPQQIGLGTRVGSIDVLHTQGATESTAKTTDLAIEGNGFFIVNDGAQSFYTRAGQFDFDSEGYLVSTVNGMRVQGYGADETGTISMDSSELDSLRVPLESRMNPQATSKVEIGGNLDARRPIVPEGEADLNAYLDGLRESTTLNLTTDYDNGNQTAAFSVLVSPGMTAVDVVAAINAELVEDGVMSDDLRAEENNGILQFLKGPDPGTETEIYNWDPFAHGTISRTARIYDSEGYNHEVTTQFVRLSDNEWRWQAVVADNDGVMTQVGEGRIDFLENGRIDADDPTNVIGEVAIDTGLLPGTVENLAIELDFAGLNQFAESTSAVVRGQNGYPSGALDTIAIDPSGVVIGSFSNGLTRDFGQVALATFRNPGGLVKVGGTMFAPSSNSGDPVADRPGSEGKGTISSNALEMSNVDLGEEFTNMIITQRGFQANSRIITSSDEMLQELVNLKR